MAVISFHSLEDRIVKHYFKSLSQSCVCPPQLPQCRCGGRPLVKLLGRHMPTKREVAQNPPSRSAVLRLLQKLRHRREDA